MIYINWQTQVSEYLYAIAIDFPKTVCYISQLMTFFDIIRIIMYLSLGSMIINYVPSPKDWIAILFLIITEVTWKLEYNNLVHRLWDAEEKKDLKNDETEED